MGRGRPAGERQRLERLVQVAGGGLGQAEIGAGGGRRRGRARRPGSGRGRRRPSGLAGRSCSPGRSRPWGRPGRASGPRDNGPSAWANRPSRSRAAPVRRSAAACTALPDLPLGAAAMACAYSATAASSRRASRGRGQVEVDARPLVGLRGDLRPRLVRLGPRDGRRRLIGDGVRGLLDGLGPGRLGLDGAAAGDGQGDAGRDPGGRAGGRGPAGGGDGAGGHRAFPPRWWCWSGSASSCVTAAG